jgi:hypothetical protein
MVHGYCEILEIQLFVYCKQKLMGDLCVACLFVMKKNTNSLNVAEREHLLLAGALLSAITRLCAGTQFVSALTVQTEDMLSIRYRCPGFCLC